MSEGLHDAHVLLNHKSHIRSLCDCESGIKKLQQPLTKPHHIMEPEMDLIMAIHHLKAESCHDIAFFMLQDMQTGSVSVDKLQKEEQMNVVCDANANDSTADAILVPPGSRAMRQLRGKWITSRFKDGIREAHTKDDLRAYAMKHLSISCDVYDSIDWTTIGWVQNRYKIPRQLCNVKMLWCWLPVGHNRTHHGATTSVCPGCGHPDETFKHLLGCPNPELCKVRNTGLESIVCLGIKHHIPMHVLCAAIKVIHMTTHPLSPPSTDNHPTIQAAIDSQTKIGIHQFITVSYRMSGTMPSGHVGRYNIHRHIELLLSMMWDYLCEPIWLCRNNLFHNGSNSATTAGDRTMMERLQW